MSDRRNLISDLIHAALQRAPEERVTFLRQACGDDHALRHEVEERLRDVPRAGGVGDQSAAVAAGRARAEPARLLGRQLGPYQVVSLLGAGGMGEVYRAHDTDLKRDVAIKVLPDALAGDAERLARFQREARVLASLNHPNIAQIHGLQAVGDTTALVMEFVDGTTLADRIFAQGRISLDEALPIAQQITEGLEAAHECGIVHRDLKPANITVRRDGTVKVLDFGVAKTIESVGAAAGGARTVTDPAMTEAGIVLGTAAYMAPEQARGKPTDRRADIWAFGCVLYEMLTGTQAFGGETVTDTLAAVVRAEPDWSALPSATPHPLVVLLRRCLRKDPRQRWQSIGDVRIGLQDALSDPASAAPMRDAPQPRIRWLAAAVAFAVVAGVGGFAGWTLKRPPQTPRPIARFTVTLPPDHELGRGGLDLAFSADGSDLAYVAIQGSSRQIYLHTLSTGESRAIPGTSGAANPFFSPDGRWLAFAAGGKLKKVSLVGSSIQDLTDLGDPSFGGTWSTDHTIVFAPYSSALAQIPDTGGKPRALTQFDAGESLHRWPEFMPDGRGLVFAALSDAPTAIAAALARTGERHDLIRGQAGDMPRFVPPNHLVYLQQDRLMAVPFDPKRLDVGRDAVPVAVISGVDRYSVSASGSLAYVAGSTASAETKLVWVTRDGKKEEPAGPPPARGYNQPRLSPDGHRIAVDVVASVVAMQVWEYDVQTDNFKPVTFEGTVNRHPVWTWDSKRIAFMSNRKGATQIFSQLADGSGGLEQLTENQSTTAADILTIPYSFSRDGQLLTYATVPPSGASQFWLLQVGSHRAQRIPFESSGDGAPEVSPDGRWVAYVADDVRHQGQIFVRPVSGSGGPWAISTSGGNEPVWNPNGHELFFRNGDAMLAAPISTDAGFVAGKPQVLFHGPYVTTLRGFARPNYDVSPDGERFLMLKPVGPEQPAIREIHVVLNWSEELKAKAPAR